MESRVKLLGHSIHPMLVVFPLGLLATAAIFDVIHVITGGLGWARASYYLIPAGFVGGVLAAIFGLIDYVAIPKRTRARRIGTIHGIGNVFVLMMFWLSWFMRSPDSDAPVPWLAVVLSVGATVLALITGWLGGELVERLSVGVDDGANVDAPSSLSGRPAHDEETRGRDMAAD
jgi:uncharacterized membrane protein